MRNITKLTMLIVFLLPISCYCINCCVKSEKKVTFSELAHIDTGGEAFKLDVVGNYAYVSDTADINPGGLVTIDISNSTNPIKCSSYFDGGYPQTLSIVDEIAYIAEWTDGLEIINVTDPHNPIKISNFYDGGMASNVKIIGDIAYIADFSDGLEIINVSNPSNPFQIRQYNPNYLCCPSFCINGSIAVLINHFSDYSGTVIIDISNLNHIVELGSYYPHDADFIYPNIHGNYVYIANHAADTGELRVLDISDPSNII